MTQYARKPAGAAFVLALVAGLGVMAAGGVFRAKQSAGDVASLEHAIAQPGADGATWAAYGDALTADGQPAKAAEAYQRALVLDPSRVQAKIGAALALAAAGEPDAFFAYVGRLTQTDAKLTADLLERPELASLRNDPRFAMASATARAQAQD